MHRKMYVIALAALYLLARIATASGSSMFLPVTGNVYPIGHYTVTISIGNDNPPKSFVLDVDTGSDLTWTRCFDNPINYYDPVEKGSVVTRGDDACASLGALGYGNNNRPRNAKCKYRVGYADGSSSAGVLVRDSIPLALRDGTTAAPNLTFGCEVPQSKYSNHHGVLSLGNHHGVLGLGKGESGILKQLSNMGVIRNVVGHCFSGQSEGGGGGYLYFGYLPILGLAWKQILNDNKHYYLGSADILLDGHSTDIRGLGITFDSGSTYTYFASEAYGALLDLVTNNLNGQLSEAIEETALPVCWQGPFQSIGDVASYFMTVALNFRDENNIRFEMPPESYLIITEMQNVCLGILNGREVGLRNMNLIGDISMQNKLVIYDNERGKVGWAAVDTCNRKF